MATIKSNGYSVNIGKDALQALNRFLTKNLYSSYFIICDENTLQHCLPLLITSCPQLIDGHIIELESGETSKSLDVAANIWQTLIENEAGKSSLLINLGGGVVSDLGGFCASVYKRGIDFINIPTSLLAMADASVGGKTGIDFSALKNVIGSFAQPKAVFIHPQFLNTLPIRHFQNGLAEVYKMALICDHKFWNELKQGLKVEALILKSVTLKNTIVLKDPFDKGPRNMLNFGHTLGHALEALLLESDQSLLHGEAILAGMLLESHIAWQKKLLSKADLNEISETLSASFRLPSIAYLSLDALMLLIRNDKKALKDKIRFSLVNKIGACKIHVEVSESQIKKALVYYNNLFS